MVIHCFVDGKSWLITGIQVHDNNQSQTVLDLFLRAVSTHGCPSCVQGDHGTENVLVAEWMEINRAVDQGSYFWGRYVCFAHALAVLTCYVGAFTTHVLRGYGTMSCMALAKNGRTFSSISRHTMV
jgi:hypothetical protein